MILQMVRNHTTRTTLDETVIPRRSRIWLYHLVSLFVAAGSLIAQQIQSLPAPQVTTFDNGYELVDNEGNLLKTVRGRQEATIQAFVDIDGVRYFMTDWSYRRALQGIKPNWIRPLPPPRPMVIPPIPQGAGTVETFSVSAARPEVQLPVGHLRAVTGAHFLPGHRLLTCSKDATTIVWDLQSGLPVQRLFLPEQCFALETMDGAPTRVKLSCGTGRRGYQQVTLDLENGRMEVREIDRESQP